MSYTHSERPSWLERPTSASHLDARFEQQQTKPELHSSKVCAHLTVCAAVGGQPTVSGATRRVEGTAHVLDYVPRRGSAVLTRLSRQVHHSACHRTPPSHRAESVAEQTCERCARHDVRALEMKPEAAAGLYWPALQHARQAPVAVAKRRAVHAHECAVKVSGHGHIVVLAKDPVVVRAARRHESMQVHAVAAERVVCQQLERGGERQRGRLPLNVQVAADHGLLREALTGVARHHHPQRCET
eukprot:896899-Prymnesium_polylepis.3